MKQRFKLVRDALSHETVICLEQLLDGARKGEVLGMAFCAMMKRREYIVNTAGEAYLNPTFTRGMIRALDDDLSRQVTKE